MKYKHKPTEIEAEQWSPPKPEEGKEVKESKEAKADRERILKGVQHSPDGDYVVTNGHPVYLTPGDYVVAEPGGSFRAIKAGDFDRDYESAEGSRESKK